MTSDITPDHINQVIDGYIEQKDYKMARKYAKNFQNVEGFDIQDAIKRIEEAQQKPKIQKVNKPKAKTRAFKTSKVTKKQNKYLNKEE